MAGKSTKRSSSSASRKGKSDAALDRPFDKAILKQAEELVDQYRLTIEPEPDLGYLGSSVELPFVMADGKTVAACVKGTREALIATVATILEDGERPPVPAREGKRDQQVNIRLTADEKYQLENAARKQGYRSISDFIRAAALADTG